MILSFVSGKGGVGKTSLAANYAWVSAQSRRTILIDLDLQNRGLSGLLERFAVDATKGAFEILAEAEKTTDYASCIVQVTDNLFFLPATSSKIDPSATRLAALVSNPLIGTLIQRRVAELRKLYDCETVILDCHGGLDYLSLGAYRVSDVTIMVTEADTVTFNGTLELLSFYQNVSMEINDSEQVCDAFTDTAIRIVVNRVPPKYIFSDLEGVYKHMVKNIGADYKLAPEVLSFLPQEDFLVASFGDYPFCAQLAPNSVFSKKIWLIDFILSGGNISQGKLSISKKIKSERFRKNVKQCIVSNETKNTQRMLSAFTALTIGFALYVLAAFPLIMVEYSRYMRPSGSVLKHELLRIGIYICMFAITFWITFALCRAMWGAARFYSDKYNFMLGLWTALGRRLKFGERIILGRLMILRLSFCLSLLFFCILPFMVMLSFGIDLFAILGSL